MGFLELASSASAWRGYDYYVENRVSSFSQVKENEFEGIVSGSGAKSYSVRINVCHPKKSTCTCPFAEGNKKICKHKVALYFAALPGESERFHVEMERAEQEAAAYEERIFALAEERIAKMKKSELQDALWQVLMEAPDWVFDRFVREWVE